MTQILITKSLTRTAIACRVCLFGSYFNATLSRQHRSGYVLLTLHHERNGETVNQEFDIDAGKTLTSESGVPVTELVSTDGLRFYAQSPAGDVWAAVNDMPQVVSPEVEAVQVQAIQVAV
jgi:hypothetical protein